MSIFHTKIGPALADGSTWAAIAAIIIAAAALEAPFSYLSLGAGILGVILKGAPGGPPQ